jgi:hypothetical protein
MRSRTPFPALLVGLALAAGLLGACGESDADKASARVCDARDDIAKQVDELKGLSLTTATTSQVQDSLNAIRNDLSTIGNAMGDLSDERREQVDAANAQFTAAVRQIADTVGRTTSVQDAATQLKQALTQLGESYKSSFGELDCS